MELHIRRFEEKDLIPLYRLLSDEKVMRYIQPPFTKDQTRDFLESAGLSETPLIYAVDNETGAFVGYVIYHDYDTERHCKEIGWVLRHDVWGKGYAKALTRQLIHRARLEGNSILIECAPEQRASKHIAEKHGFSYAGQRDGCDVYKLETERTRGCDGNSV